MPRRLMPAAIALAVITVMGIYAERQNRVLAEQLGTRWRERFAEFEVVPGVVDGGGFTHGVEHHERARRERANGGQR